ncbi:Uncharacterised protein [Mycobacteroides abscessus subsp. abscessus]|nr:Uncharacterised protein [Mycobacteroides abscessus subsp. abscessus]
MANAETPAMTSVDEKMTERSEVANDVNSSAGVQTKNTSRDRTSCACSPRTCVRPRANPMATRMKMTVKPETTPDTRMSVCSRTLCAFTKLASGLEWPGPLGVHGPSSSTVGAAMTPTANPTETNPER